MCVSACIQRAWARPPHDHPPNRLEKRHSKIFITETMKIECDAMKFIYTHTTAECVRSLVRYLAQVTINVKCEQRTQAWINFRYQHRRNHRASRNHGNLFHFERIENRLKREPHKVKVICDLLVHSGHASAEIRSDGAQQQMKTSEREAIKSTTGK